ncbi:hypothetical protein Aperf_G00000102527 [Anoplocephala perfoliata]
MPEHCGLAWNLFQVFVSEAVGTGILCLPAFLLPPATVQPDIATPLVCGMALYLGLWITGATSGGQMNPVVTLAAAITRRTPLLFVPVYLVAQFAGALVSMGLAFWLSPYTSSAGNTYGLTLPSQQTSVGMAIVMEIIITMILIFTWLASLDEVRNGLWRLDTSNNFPMAMMLAIALCVGVGGQISGASMNPFRSLSAAIVQHNFDYVWIYFVGPPIGSILACLIYELVICEYSSLRRTKAWLTSKSFDRADKYTDKSEQLSSLNSRAI